MDDSFGPTVTNCRGDFDFTLLFEQSIMSIGPSAILLLLFPLRLMQLLQQDMKTRRHWLQLMKQVSGDQPVIIN